MNANWVGRGALWAIFVAALVVRLAVLAVRPETAIPPDGVDYNRLAIALWEGQGYVGSEGQPTSERPPLYPLFLAAVFTLFGYNLEVAKVVQATMDAGTCALIFVIAGAVFDRRIAWIAAGLAVFHLSLIFAATTVLVETLLTFLLVVVVLYVLRVTEGRAVGDQLVLGGLLGLAALTRGSLLVLPVFVLVPLLWVERKELRGGLRKAAVVLAAFCIVVAPWALRNYRVHGELVPVATQVGHVFYSSYKPPDGKIFGVYTFDETVTRARSTLPEAAASDFLFKETLRYIGENPGVLWYLSFLKLGYWLSPFDWEVLGGDGIYNFSFAFVFPVSLLGMYLWRKRKGALVLALPILHSLFVSLLLYGSPRLRLSVEPFFIVFAAAALSAAFVHYSDRVRAVGLATGLFFAINVSLYLLSGEVKRMAASGLRTVGLW